MTAYVPVSTEVGLDAGWWPWLAPDPCPVPRIDLLNGWVSCPRLSRSHADDCTCGWGDIRDAVETQAAGVDQ